MSGARPPVVWNMGRGEHVEQDGGAGGIARLAGDTGLAGPPGAPAEMDRKPTGFHTSYLLPVLALTLWNARV